jgi:Ca-dependent carbohydrate-binding module xylan-binding
MSGDNYANKDGTSDAAGDPSFTVSIDGKQIGGTFTTVASESAGQTQSFILNGTFGTGSHTVAVTFLNDAWGGTGSTDRNLYVNDLVYLGTDTKDSAALYSNGTQKFSVTGGTAPTPAPTPTLAAVTSTSTPTPSPDDTVITTSGSKPITDGTGNLWNIVNGQVTLNGTTDTTTANVVELAFVRGTIWDETASNVWQYKATPTSAWAPPGGTTTPPISVAISANNQTQVVDATIAQSATDAGATLDITASGIATATLGSGSVTMAFAAMQTVNVTGGSGSSQVTLDGGTLSLDAGTGPLTVSGGPGADAYSYHVGSGKLTISDFTVSQGDVLKIDSALQGAMKTSTDGSGGTLLTFGTSAGGIDLQGVTTLLSNGVKWV